MNEILCSLHIHSIYSDGSGDYTRITRDALKAGVNVIIITDHNVRVKNLEQVFEQDGKRVLVLTGEEVHDANRMPQKNHLLAIGCDEEVAQFASDPQVLIDHINKIGGVSFLAHPYEYALSMFNETDITWEAWHVKGFTGLELWNGLSEFKTVVTNLWQALFYAFFPAFIATQPLSQALQKWDELLASGQKVNVVAGADAHALHKSAGPLHKVIFPYTYHFSSIRNHLLLPEPLSGNLETDQKAVYNALKDGSSFIGYDLAAPTNGFQFTVENGEEKVGCGGELDINQGATLRVSLPRKAEIRLIHDGKVIEQVADSDRLVKVISQPGAYRVEAYIHHLGRSRGWIFSNPIYARKSKLRQFDLES